MLPEKHNKTIQEHFAEDKEIDRKQLNKIEGKLDNHSKFKIGENHGQLKRAMRDSKVHTNGQVPVMRGAEKDHKADKSKIKMRPMVNAMDGPKKNISDNF